MAEETKLEQTPKKIHPTSKRIRYIRDQIAPTWQDLTKMAENSGLQPEGPKSSSFRKFRKEEMKKRLTIQLEGEVDLVTGLPNRRGVLRRIDEEIRRIKRETYPELEEEGEHKGSDEWIKYFNYDVLFLDLNNLKEINDLSPDRHSTGDVVLKKLGDKLTEEIRVGDFVGRWGGDEFILFLRRDHPNASNKFWERLSQDLHDDNLWVSAGLARLDPTNIDSSIETADKAMYLAKTLTKKNKERTRHRINMMRTESDLTIPLKQT